MNLKSCQKPEAHIHETSKKHSLPWLGMIRIPLSASTADASSGTRTPYKRVDCSQETEASETSKHVEGTCCKEAMVHVDRRLENHVPRSTLAVLKVSDKR